MGGSGKTTLAKRLYNDKYPSMEKSSLLLDVRDAANRNLLHKKQKKLLKDLGFKGVSVDNIEEGKAILASHLRLVWALIVLDDVDHMDQLNALLPAKDSSRSESLIGSGTLIIITTRELEVLRSWSISSIYTMKPMSRSHAMELFCWHAFLHPSSRDGFEELVKKKLQACSGLPLSLKVLGGQLYGNFSKDHWETQLEKISRILPKDIKHRLKISYDALDNEEKKAFLDIACFFIREEINLAIEVWNGSGWSGLHIWKRLRNKCLDEVDKKNFIRMHDHLRDLGREIANEQSPYRLWFCQRTIKVSNEQNGIGTTRMTATARVLNKYLCFKVYNEDQKRIGIRGIVANSFRTGLDFYNSLPPEELGDCSSHAELKVNTSRGISSLATSRLGLKIIVARGPNLNHVISEVSRDLVWLRWFDIGQRNLQSLIPMKNLRVLELYEDRRNHHLRELWVVGCDAPLQLRELVISGCLEFQGFPKSIGYLQHLKKLVLYSKFRTMNNVESLPEEFCFLKSLEHLDLVGCCELSSLPNSMGNLRNLRHLALKMCSKLGRLPDSLKELMLLQHLDLRGCVNLTFRSDIMENMSKLEHLEFSECDRLEELPLHITNQASLRELYLRDVKRLRELPMKIGQLRKLRELTIGSNSLTSLPTSLGDLSSLTELRIEGCGMLEYLPDSMGHLNLLERLYIMDSRVKSLPESVSQLISLQILFISDCPVSKLDLGAGSFSSSLCKLKEISLHGTELSKISISEDCCLGLKTLTVGSNDRLTEIEVLPGTVRKLDIAECPNLSLLPSFAQLTSLREFELRGCYQVKEFQGIQHCRELEKLKAYTRWKVPSIQSLECMERLRTLHLTAMSKSVVEGCIQSLQKWPDEIIVCNPAVRNAASLVNSSALQTLSVVDSFSNLKIDRRSMPELVRKRPANSNAIIVCFVITINWVTRHKSWLMINGAPHHNICEMEVEEGKWVWMGVFTQRSKWHTSDSYNIFFNGRGEAEIEVEKGLLMMGEEHRLLEALRGLWGMMAI